MSISNRFTQRLLPMVVSLCCAATAVAQPRQISTQLEEIIVTAEKREQNLQDVAISVSAMDSAMIEKTFARTIQDVASMSPNLIIDPTLGNGTASIAIRGMQLNDVEKSFDPAVAVYQDGVYLATSTGALLNTWDAERIEVLRGPQGTMFGRNTIGGLIHIVRAKPQGEWGGKLSVTVAEDDQQDLKGTLHFPEVANIATKLSVINMSGGGYFDNIVRNDDEGETDLTQWSFSALWSPTDTFSVQLTYDDLNDDTPARPITCMTESPELFAVLGLSGTDCASFKDEDHHRKTRTTSEQTASIDLEAITIQADWDITEAHKLVAIYAQREMDETNVWEADGIQFDAFRVSRPQFENQESLELRLESEWSWGRSILGGFYWDSDYQAWQNTYFFGGFNDSPLTFQETENFAVFGQVDIDINERLTLSLGGRYTDEEKTFCQVFTAPDAAGPVTDYDGIQKSPLRGWGLDCPTWAQGVVENNYTNPVTGQAEVFPGKEGWSQFTPKIGISYESDFGLLFLSYTEGFRSGGFNGRATGAANAGPYEPENVENWEAGFKTQWFDNTLQLNGSFFVTDYQDKQEDVVLPGTDGAVTLTLVQNAAGADISGFELEAVWLPMAGLTLTANLGILDAEYKDYTVVDPAGLPLDKSGFDLRRAPELNYSVGALYEIQLPNDALLVTNVSYRWIDDYLNNASAGGPKHYSDDPLYVTSFGMLDASINYETENWRLSVFGKNLTDESYFVHVLDVAAGYSATSATNPDPVYVPGLWTFGTINRPRYFGAEVQYKF